MKKEIPMQIDVIRRDQQQSKKQNWKSTATTSHMRRHRLNDTQFPALRRSINNLLVLLWQANGAAGVDVCLSALLTVHIVLSIDSTDSVYLCLSLVSQSYMFV